METIDFKEMKLHFGGYGSLASRLGITTRQLYNYRRSGNIPKSMRMLIKSVCVEMGQNPQPPVDGDAA
jgi:hypothetical protein